MDECTCTNCGGREKCSIRFEPSRKCCCFWKPELKPIWIPCSERLPEDGQRVLICSKSKRFFDVIFRANAQMPSFCAEIFGKVYAWYCEDIIKWMPLPEPPKEADNE